MSTDFIVTRNDVVLLNETWHSPDPKPISCPVVLTAEEDGYVAYSANLAGVVSQGETAIECIDRIRESLRLVLTEYKKSSTPIPWVTREALGIPEGTEYRISVNV